MYVTSNYSFLKNVTITSLSTNGNTVTVNIKFDVYFTQSAWKTFRYADGSFNAMNAWWQSNPGQTFSYAGFTGKLISIHWTLLNHYSDHDRLNAVATIQYIGWCTKRARHLERSRFRFNTETVWRRKIPLLRIAGLPDKMDRGELHLFGQTANRLNEKQRVKLRLEKIGSVFQFSI